jgi:FkbM family methyltransferase
VVAYRRSSLETQYAIDTRLSVLNLKLSGKLPHVSWAVLGGRLGSAWMTDGPPPLSRIVARGSAPCTVLWETPMGKFWGTDRDGRDLDLIAMEQIGWRVYDREPARVHRGDIVYDVGAHLGTFTRFALDRGASKVVMFEPQRVNVQCLHRTFDPEIRDGRVVLVEAAAWESVGTLSFSDKGPGTMGHVDEAGSEPGDVAVPATTFDRIARDLSLPRVDFIKMDIEGAERHALAGGAEILARFKPRMAVCIYHQADDRSVIPRVVHAANPSYEVTYRSGFQAYFF